MLTITDVVSQVNADFPTVTTVTAEVRDAEPVPFSRSGSVLSPRSIRVGYWNHDSAATSVTVYGPEVVEGVVSPLLRKAVFWSDTLGSAPEWVREFVAQKVR